MAKLTGYNLAIGLVVALGGLSYGFITGAFATSLGQPGFYMYFSLDPTSAYTASIIGGANGAFNGGGALGSLSQGFIADRIGRKKAIIMSATFILIGGALLAGSVHLGMLITVRLIQGLGVGMVTCLGPLYLAEVAPPHRRGFFSGLAPMGYGLGLNLASWVSVGTSFGQLNLQWRLPLALAVLPTLGQLIGLAFIPESPRYLVLKDRNDEAWRVVQRIHHDEDDPSDSAAHAEYTQMIRQIEFDKTEDKSFRAMFTKPSWRRRTILAMFLQFSAMSTGIQGVLNYLVIIYASLGVGGTMGLILFAVYTTVGGLAVLLTILYVDRIGRRPCFLIGFPALAGCLLAIALLQWRYLGTSDQGGNGACIFFIFLFAVMFQLVDAPTFVWITEIFPTTIRAKGTSLAIFAFFVGNITYTTPSALAFRNFGYRMYLIYMALCLVITIIVYFFIPETKQLPMEELGALFGDEVVVHLTQDGHGIVEGEQNISVPSADKLKADSKKSSVNQVEKV